MWADTIKNKTISMELHQTLWVGVKASPVFKNIGETEYEFTFKGALKAFYKAYCIFSYAIDIKKRPFPIFYNGRYKCYFGIYELIYYYFTR